MDRPNALRLVGLLDGLASERPPRYVALAMRIRLLIADGRLEGLDGPIVMIESIVGIGSAPGVMVGVGQAARWA